MQPTTTGVAATVRAEAARRGFSQRDLAKRAGINEATFSRRLRGTSPFTVDELARVAAALDVPLTALIVHEPAA